MADESTEDLPPALVAERDALIAEIYDAFEGVTREGGVSWSESYVIDVYGSDEEREIARSKDRERSWTEMVDDEQWETDRGMGGWSFLDAVGFRYYLPAAMIQSAREGCDVGIQFHLTLPQGELREWVLEKWSLFTEEQRKVTARFLNYMVNLGLTYEYGFEVDDWFKALESHWGSLRLIEGSDAEGG